MSWVVVRSGRVVAGIGWGIVPPGGVSVAVLPTICHECISHMHTCQRGARAVFASPRRIVGCASSLPVARSTTPVDCPPTCPWPRAS
ncbi:hypothetical protein FRIGORI9N_470129 [Frigoribacterium sp. 9N]|nr:hypothetical protein FRIGORI9N_470129 [Frigoribacterium sp. 9N]